MTARENAGARRYDQRMYTADHQSKSKSKIRMRSLRYVIPTFLLIVRFYSGNCFQVRQWLGLNWLLSRYLCTYWFFRVTFRVAISSLHKTGRLNILSISVLLFPFLTCLLAPLPNSFMFYRSLFPPWFPFWLSVSMLSQFSAFAPPIFRSVDRQSAGTSYLGDTKLYWL